MTALSTTQTHPPSNAAPAAPAGNPHLISGRSAPSGRAVEVVASFGGSVVGVRHVADPKSGATRALTKAMLIGGASLLAASALAFGYAQDIASENAAAAKAWAEAKKPMWAFRPEMLPGSLDGLMFAGSAIGMAALVWGLSRRKTERRPSRVRVGSDATADFASEGTAAFDLVAPQGDGFVCNLVEGMEGEITVGGERRPLAVGPVTMTADTRLRVKLGATTFHVSSVPAPAATATGIGLQRRPLAFLAASAIVHLGAVMILRNVAPGLDTASGDDTGNEMAYVTGSTEDRETPPPVEIIETGSNHQNGQEASPNNAMSLEAGKSGTDKPSNNPGERKIKNDGVDPQMARERAKQAAAIAGILESEHFQQREMFASMRSNSLTTSGYDDADIYSWQGPGDGDGEGNFSHGPSGPGPGGGNQWDTFKAGPYRTLPDGGDGTDPTGKCKPGQKCTGKDPLTRTHVATEPEPKVNPGKPKCTGDAECDRELIRRYMKRHASKFQYCYEKELLAQPKLAGTVDTLFMVSTNGQVVKVEANGVSEGVSSCVEDVIEDIQFPKFELAFQVSYPFEMYKAGA